MSSKAPGPVFPNENLVIINKPRTARLAAATPRALDDQNPAPIHFLLWMLIAAAFRFAALPGGGIWFDELFTVKIAAFSPAEICDWIRFDTHPALYYLLVHAFMRLGQWLGPGFISLAWLRMSAVLPSLVTCAVIALWAWRAQGRRAALTALALAAVSPGLLFYSQELRNYSLAIMFVTLAGFHLARLLRRPNPVDSLFYVFSTLGFLYSHNLTIVVFIGNCAWALLYSRLFGVRPGRGLRGAVYGSTLAILLLALPQLQFSATQFTGQYQPMADLLPDVHWYDLLITFFYNFPAGPVETQDWLTPYGFIAIYLSAALTVLLLAALWRGRRRLALAPAARLPLAYCGFMLCFFLVSTWAATMLEFGKLFYAHRTSMIVLPLWILLLAFALESLPRAWTRRRGRLLLLAFTIPCGFLSLDYRNAYRTDFAPLIQSNRRLDKDGPLRLRDYHVTDEMLAPWIQRPGPGLRIAGIGRMLEQGRGGQVILVNSIAERLQTDREAFTDAFIRHWAATHQQRPELAEWKNPVYTLGADEATSFSKSLESLWSGLQREIVRGPDRLVLLPYCQEFNNARGMHLPDFDQGKAYRWTRGPMQGLAWRAPERPGRYQLTISFYWPSPRPRPRMSLEYRIGERGAFKTMDVAPGSVAIRETIETRSPREPLSIEMFSDFYIPALWDRASKDYRRLGLMFTRLEMSPAAAE